MLTDAECTEADGSCIQRTIKAISIYMAQSPQANHPKALPGRVINQYSIKPNKECLKQNSKA